MAMATRCIAGAARQDRGEIRDAEAALTELRSVYATLGTESGLTLLDRFDPDQHRRRLLWLAQLRGAIAQGETELAVLEDARSALGSSAARSRTGST